VINIIAIIPCRGGSKRLPRKNVLNFNGKPLLYWTIKAAQDSQCFDKIYVSTEDDEIKEWALYYGVDVINRPMELAQDNSSSVDVIKHALKVARENGDVVYSFMLLQPTSPLREIEDIKIIKNYYMEELHFESVVSVCNTGLGEYKHNGNIYACTTGYYGFFEKYGLWNENTYLYIMSKERSVDINNINDWKLGEEIMLKRSIKASV
jgi:CMP-N,N'-diacetyllegionaminic acid synthase